MRLAWWTAPFVCSLTLCGTVAVVCDALQSSNGVVVNQPIIDLIQRLTYLNACTFSFATHSNPLTQHMYECVTCNQVVCVVCMVRQPGFLGFACVPTQSCFHPSSCGDVAPVRGPATATTRIVNLSVQLLWTMTRPRPLTTH